VALRANPSGNIYKSSLLPADGISFIEPVTHQEILRDASGNVYVSIPSLGAFYELSDDAVATVINGIDYISGLAVDPAHSISVADYRPADAPATVSVTYALSTNEFVLRWPGVLATTSYIVTLYSNTQYATTGGTILLTRTVATSPCTLQHAMIDGVFYYATVTSLPLNAWAPQRSDMVTLNSIVYTVPIASPSSTESVVVIGNNVYVSTEVPGNYYKLTDSMKSSVLNGVYYITEEVGSNINIPLQTYTSFVKPAISFVAGPLIQVEWATGKEAIVYLYRAISSTGADATLVAVMKSNRSSVIFPETVVRTAFYYAKVMIIVKGGLDECNCITGEEPLAIETTPIITLVGTQFPVNVYETATASPAPSPSSMYTVIEGSNTSVFISAEDGVYQLTDSMVYTLLNGIAYISRAAPATVNNIYLSDYSILQSPPAVTLEYARATNKCIISWLRVPNSTSYILRLYSNTTPSTSSGTIVTTVTATSPTTLPLVLSGLYYYATVMPYTGSIQGLLGTSQLLSSATVQITLPVVTGSSTTYDLVTVNGNQITGGNGFTLTDAMASTLANSILYISGQAAAGSNIYIDNYASQTPPPIQFFYSSATQTCIVEWDIIETVSSYTLTLYSNTIPSIVGGTVLYTSAAATSPTTIPLVLAQGLYYYVTLQPAGYTFLSISQIITYKGITYSVPLTTSSSLTQETIVVDEKGVFWGTAAGTGIYTKLQSNILQTILQNISYISGFTTDSAEDIALKRYLYATVPTVTLSYSTSANEWIIGWKYIPTATSYTVQLYRNTNASTTGGTLLFTQTGAISVTTISYASVTSGMYYYAAVLPVFPSLPGVAGISNLYTT